MKKRFMVLGFVGLMASGFLASCGQQPVYQQPVDVQPVQQSQAGTAVVAGAAGLAVGALLAHHHDNHVGYSYPRYGYNYAPHYPVYHAPVVVHHVTTRVYHYHH